MNNQCKHGTPWHAHCPECELALALEAERRHGQEIDEARKVIERAQENGWEVRDGDKLRDFLPNL